MVKCLQSGEFGIFFLTFTFNVIYFIVEVVNDISINWLTKSLRIQ